MLYLIKGRAGSGKTDYINRKIKSILDSGSGNVLLVVPEQFSFESERKMLKYLGEESYNKIDIFSFPRLASYVLKDKFNYSDVPSTGVRLAIMHEALLTLQGRLNIFGKSKATVNSLTPLVDFSRELKYCSVKSDDITSKLQLLSNEFLKEKLKEISLINDTYDALVKQSYFDDTEALDVLNEYAIDYKYFSDKTIFIDGFRAFTKQEAAVFDTMLTQANDVFVTLCADSTYQKNSSFTFIKKFEDQLNTIANNRKISVEREVLNQNENSFSRDISVLEKNIFNPKITEATPTDGSVKVVECFNSDDECDYISKEIKRLLRSGKYRCRDIAVIERTAGTYKKRIVDRLRKLEVPVFDDSRRSLKYEALFIYMDSLLKCISSGFTSDALFSYLKSGLSGVSIEKTAILEKYALIWKISGSKWSEDFTMHPKGFGKEFTEKDSEHLARINEVRRNAVVPLLKLRKDCKDKTGLEISAVIYDFLVSQHIPDRLYDLYSSLNEEGFSVEANRQSVSWDVLMSIFDSMSKIYSERVVSLAEWVDKFNLLVDSGDVGEIPQGLDEVKIGSADRIRTDKLKVVFLVGVNKCEFPLVTVKNGVLTDYDRVSLSSVDIKLNPPFKDTIDEERFISYCAVTAASEKLYLVYKTVADDGVEVSASEIIADAQKCISGITVINADELPVIDEIECEEDAFYLLSKNYSSDNTVKATLEKYFENNEEYLDKLSALDRAVGKKNFAFTDPNLSTDLFGKEINISPSSIETFYKCPFSFFMEYGLNAKDVELAELDRRISGSIVHYVLENVLKDYFAPKIKIDADGNSYKEISSEDFVNATKSEIITCVKNHLQKYLEDMMGNLSEQSKRFIYLYNRVVDICEAVLDRFQAEFKIGSFKPHDFELVIGEDNHKEKKMTADDSDNTVADSGDKKIPAYSLSLDEGNINVSGKIDRVDIYDKGNTRYIRVVDYKTGKKDFRLSELLSGSNLQMVLYLMAILKNGKEYYESDDILPAGVLYIPSKIGLNNYISSRNPSSNEIKSAKNKSGKLKGMVLKSPVVFNAMGVVDNSELFPVYYNKDKELKGNYFTQLNFRELSKKIDEKIIGMGNSLHKGDFFARPLADSGEPIACGYCKYKGVCGFEDGDEVEEIFKDSHSKVLEMLGGE